MCFPSPTFCRFFRSQTMAHEHGQSPRAFPKCRGRFTLPLFSVKPTHKNGNTKQHVGDLIYYMFMSTFKSYSNADHEFGFGFLGRAKSLYSITRFAARSNLSLHGQPFEASIQIGTLTTSVAPVRVPSCRMINPGHRKSYWNADERLASPAIQARQATQSRQQGL